MQRFLRTVTAVVIAAVAGTSVAAAQSISYGLGGGLILPTSDYSTLDKTGWHGLGKLDIGIPMSPVSVRADVMYGQTNHQNTSGGATVAGNTKLIGGTADLVWHIPTTVPGFKPYALAGVGVYNVKSEYPPAAAASSTHFTWGGGVGTAVGVGPVHAFVEGRYMSIQATGGSLKFLPITAGLSFGTK